MPKKYNRKKLKNRVYKAMRKDPFISLRPLAIKLKTSWSLISPYYHSFREDELRTIIESKAV